LKGRFLPVSLDDVGYINGVASDVCSQGGLTSKSQENKVAWSTSQDNK